MDIAIKGNWRIQVEDSIFDIPEPAVMRVTDEIYDSLPLYEKRGGWNDGKPLKSVAATNCSLPMAVDPFSLHLRLPDGTPLIRGTDFEYTEKWGTIGRLNGGKIGDSQQIFASYRCILNRMDSIIRRFDGTLKLAVGTPASFCAKAPEVMQGETRLLNIFTDAQTDKLALENIYPILETSCPAENTTAQQTFISKTMEKLRNGEKLRILAWGDSVTACTYMPENCKWQCMFAERLRALFPKAEIELISNGWDGRTIPAFMNEPSGSIHNYQETVLDTGADLVVSEFINDCGLPPEKWTESYGRVLNDFRRLGMDWIMMTPHYMRPDWMGLATQNGVVLEDDPRPYVAFMRKFAADNNVAIADAAKKYGRLWRQGIPYNTLMTNNINHPDERGMKLFADTLMAIFGA